MAEVLRTLCGYTSVGAGCHVILVGENLDPGTEYHLMVDTAGSDDSPTGNFMFPNPQGHVAWSIANNNLTRAYYLHAGSDPDSANRVGDAVLVTWATGGTIPVYGSPPVLSAEPHRTAIVLNWTPSTGCDPLLSSVTYDVMEAGNVRGNDLLATTLTISGLIIGSVHTYRIRPTFHYVEGLISITNREPNDPAGLFYESNVLTVTCAPATMFGTAVLTGAGDLVGTGLRTTFAQVDLTGQGDLVVVAGNRVVQGQAKLTGLGTLRVLTDVKEAWGMISS